MSDELRPCPFCGGEARRDEVPNRFGDTLDVIACTDCSALSRPVHWNTRHDPVLEEVRSLLINASALVNGEFEDHLRIRLGVMATELLTKLPAPAGDEGEE